MLLNVPPSVAETESRSMYKRVHLIWSRCSRWCWIWDLQGGGRNLSHCKRTLFTVHCTSSKVSKYHGNRDALALPHLRHHCLQICTKKATNCSALQSFFIKAYWPCWSSGHQQVSCRSLCQGLDGLPFCCSPLEVLRLSDVCRLASSKCDLRVIRSPLIRSCLALSHYYCVSPIGGTAAGNPRRRPREDGRDWGVLGRTLMGLHTLRFSKNLMAGIFT